MLNFLNWVPRKLTLFTLHCIDKIWNFKQGAGFTQRGRNSNSWVAQGEPTFVGMDHLACSGEESLKHESQIRNRESRIMNRESQIKNHSYIPYSLFMQCPVPSSPALPTPSTTQSPAAHTCFRDSCLGVGLYIQHCAIVLGMSCM